MGASVPRVRIPGELLVGFHNYLPKGPRPLGTWMCTWCGKTVSPEDAVAYNEAANEAFRLTGEWPKDCVTIAPEYMGLESSFMTRPSDQPTKGTP